MRGTHCGKIERAWREKKAVFAGNGDANPCPRFAAPASGAGTPPYITLSASACFLEGTQRYFHVIRENGIERVFQTYPNRSIDSDSSAEGPPPRGPSKRPTRRSALQRSRYHQTLVLRDRVMPKAGLRTAGSDGAISSGKYQKWRRAYGSRAARRHRSNSACYCLRPTRMFDTITCTTSPR